MNGNILTQTSWKVTVVFTLTVLFATTCLLLTDLPAGHVVGENADWARGWAAGTANLWGEAYVCTWYDAPYAKSCHDAYMRNDSGDRIKAYYEFDAKVVGPVEIGMGNEKGDEWVDNEKSWNESANFSLDMTDKPIGKYTIHAFSDLTAKSFVGGLEIGGWHASIARTEFNID